VVYKGNKPTPATKKIQRSCAINLETAVAGLNMAHLPNIALAFEHLHHVERP
jgi:hypothetical protein